MNNNEIAYPTTIKKIAVYLINIILFVAYYLILSFIGGLITGFVTIVLGNDIDTLEVAYPNLYSIIAAVALLTTIILSVFLRKKIYFHTAQKAPATTPSTSTTATASTSTPQPPVAQ